VQNANNGTFARVKATFSVPDVGGRNSLTKRQILVARAGPGDYKWTQESAASGTLYILGGGNVSVDFAHNVTITLTDTIGSTATWTAVIPSAQYMVHYKAGGKAIGFGKTAGADGTASFGWPCRVHAGHHAHRDPQRREPE